MFYLVAIGLIKTWKKIGINISTRSALYIVSNIFLVLSSDWLVNKIFQN